MQRIKNIYHLLQAIAANIWYGFPSRHIQVIGVTGTDGKTTTTHLLYHLLSKAGKNVSMISTIYGRVGNVEYDTGLHVTTPDPFMIQKMIRDAVLFGDDYFILETTSHAIDQNRTWGITYKAAILTNITHEHLDYHKSLDEYATTKLSLIQRSEIGIVNSDDPETRKRLSTLLSQTNHRILTYGLVHRADYQVDFRKSFPRLADFNAYNFLGAYALCRELGFPDEELRTFIPSFVLPLGRIDMVFNEDFTVIVDFAHTPNSLVRILETVRRLYCKEEGRIIHVFGAAGLRDVTKRPLMGEASAQGADVSIITEEDYRTENPIAIAHQIGEGFQKYNKKYIVQTNREKAIQQAISLARPHDVVVITGKGHEKSLCRGTTEHPWSDSDCVKRYVPNNR